MTSRSIKVPLTLAALALACVSCSVLKPKPDLTQYYLLRAQAPQSQPGSPPGSRQTSLIVGPGHLAEYLNSLPILVTEAPNRLQRLDQHQWAEPLASGVHRVLVENLIHLLPGAELVAYPDTGGRPSWFELRYHLFKLEGGPGREVVLEVSWSLREQPNGRPVAERTSTFMVPTRGTPETVDDYVTRLSRALSDWSILVGQTLAPELGENH